MRESEACFRQIVETAQEGIWTIDAAGNTTFVNEALAAMLGYTASEMMGMPMLDLIQDSGREAARAYLVRRRGDIPQKLEVRFCHRGGREVWGLLSANPLFDSEDRYAGAFTMVVDITERKHYEEQLKSQALHDPLTGVPNRALFHDRFEHAMRAADRDATQLSLLSIDLDRFKEINDLLGHHAGDRFLHQIAQRFQEQLRTSDTIARIGGDEFTVLLPDTDGPGATRVATKLMDCLEEPVELDGRALYGACSIGVVTYPEHGEDAVTLLQRADRAMYVAKRELRGYAVYDEDSDRHPTHCLELTRELRTAIEEGGLTVQYQPLINFQTGCADHVEALARWNHPERGMVPPGEFIELAEQTGLIRPLTLCVLRQAIQQVKTWRAAGLDMNVTVNLSVWCLQDPLLVETVAEILAIEGVPAEALTLEITESALMMDPKRAMETLSTFHAMGIRLTIDDFGTGYSSLAYLTRLPVDGVKIDRSFVLAMADSTSESAVVVRSVIDLGHNLGLTVVAEGVESQDKLDILALMGCDQAQGYFLSLPLPADDIQPWMEHWHGEARWRASHNSLLTC